jgi:hypothetical protein
MCNPLMIGAAVATLAGTGAQIHGQRKAEKAAVNVRRAEDARQAGFREQAETAFAGNQRAFEREAIDENMAAKQTAREAAYRAANANAPRAAAPVAAGSLGGNKVVQSNLANTLRDTSKRTTAQGAARAELGSFNDAMFDASLLQRRGREGIGMASSFGRGSLNATGAELQAAQHKGDRAKQLGQILSTIGAAMSAGAGAAAAGAGAAAGGGLATSASAGMMAQPFMQSLPASTFGAGWLTPVAAAL